jgi:hypothetical protein
MDQTTIETGKPYRHTTMNNKHIVVNHFGLPVVIVPAGWGDLSEGIAEGVAFALNKMKRIELPATPHP